MTVLVWVVVPGENALHQGMFPPGLDSGNK